MRSYRVEECLLVVDGRVVECEGVGFSGCGDVSGEICVLDVDDFRGYSGLRGRVGVVYGDLSFDVYRRLVEAGPLALIIVEGSVGRPASKYKFCWEWVGAFGRVPAVRVSLEDGLRIARSGGRARVVVESSEFDVEALNVVGRLEGGEEELVVCSHYDSVVDCVGVIDNAAGVALMLELARCLSSVDRRRSLVFIGFGAEELGLRGSRFYCEKRRESLDRVRLAVNLDVHGSVFGSYSACVIGPVELKPFIEAIGCEEGLRLSVSFSVQSSDSASFSFFGVPSVSFFRGGGLSAYLHTELDSLEIVDSSRLERMGRVVEKFLSRLAVAEPFPFKREIPKEHVEKVREYFKKKFGV